MAGPPRDIELSTRVAKFLRYDAHRASIFCDADGFYCLRNVLQLRRFAAVSAADIWNEVTRDKDRFDVSEREMWMGAACFELPIGIQKGPQQNMHATTQELAL